VEPALISLCLAALAFVGSHFALSHPLRARLASQVGEKPFAGIYSIVSLATFAWMALAFASVTPRRSLWNGASPALWIVGSLLTLIALALFLGSLRGNPAFPGAQIHPEGVQPRPHGVFRVTRHPMMWGFALWAAAHILVSPTSRSLVLPRLRHLATVLGLIP
jgi:uncharacterized membrane protein